MAELSSNRRAAASGQAKSLVMFLHGYGADGADLLGLAEPLAPHMPDTVFVAPDAPEPCAANPMGYQWFSIPWLDGSSEQAAREGMERAVLQVGEFIDATLQKEGISNNKAVIFGFSQGTMLALHVVPRRAACMAGIVGCSGRLLEPGKLAAEARSKPPVLLLHGDRDEMVPPQALGETATALQAAGFDVETHVMRGMGHGIAPDGLAAALQFMHDKLY